MRFRPVHYTHAFLILFGIVAAAGLGWAAENQEPPRVTPGLDGSPPSDAIVLFGGETLSRWQSTNGDDAPWKVADGVMEVNGTGSILTRQEFGDVQLHVEWATPESAEGSGQERGNSGIYLQGRYEIQVLDSYDNPTYYTGQAGAFYGNFAPLVNASRKSGEWQTYDIIFHAPTRQTDGSFTVLHNGVLVQDHVPVKKPGVAPPGDGPIKGPIALQDHGSPVRYRNIWVRPLVSNSVHSAP